MVTKRALLGLFVALAISLLGRRAGANSMAPFSRPTGAVPGVVVERASPVVVEREELVIDCAKEGSPVHPKCTFAATYFLHNPGAAEEELLGAFYLAVKGSSRAPESAPPLVPLSIRVDGADAHAAATGEQLARMDALVREDRAVASLLEERGLGLRREPFRVILAAGARGKLTFEGTLEVTDYGGHSLYKGYVAPAIQARHVFLAPSGGREWDASHDDFLYLVSPIRRWAGDPEVHVTIRHPEANDFSAPGLGFVAAEGARGTTTEKAVLRASSGQNLRFGLAYTPPFVHRGGPIVGLGARIAREELRVRLGYEVGLSDSFLLGAVVDTNFDEYVTPAVTLDAATPSLLFVIPSLSVGAGAAMQFRRGAAARVGARGQLGMSWPLVGILFPVDVYPAANSSGSHVEASFLVQLTF